MDTKKYVLWSDGLKLGMEMYGTKQNSNRDNIIKEIKKLQKEKGGMPFSDEFLNIQSYTDLVNILRKLKGETGHGHPFED